MMWTLGLKRDESWLRTSAKSCWCLSTLRIFMMRTIAAWISNFLSSSKCRWVASCSCFSSAFMGMLMLTRNFLLKKTLIITTMQLCLVNNRFTFYIRWKVKAERTVVNHFHRLRMKVIWISEEFELPKIRIMYNFLYACFFDNYL